MPSIAVLALGGFTAVYVFLRLILHLTQDAREPPAVLTSVPFLGPMVGAIREKSGFHLRLRYVIVEKVLALLFNR